MRTQKTRFNIYGSWEYDRELDDLNRLSKEGWHYFRKPYPENMSEEDLEIYSDKESLVEMQNRYKWAIVLLAIIYSFMTIVNIIEFIATASAKTSITSVLSFLIAAIMWIVLWNIKRKQNDQKEFLPIRASVFFLVLFIMILQLVFL